jgi:hypothetical protein
LRSEASVRNDVGDLPVHLKDFFKAPTDIARAIIRAYPEGLMMSNEKGRLPIHFMVGSCHKLLALLLVLDLP